MAGRGLVGERGVVALGVRATYDWSWEERRWWRCLGRGQEDTQQKIYISKIKKRSTSAVSLLTLCFFFLSAADATSQTVCFKMRLSHPWKSRLFTALLLQGSQLGMFPHYPYNISSTFWKNISFCWYQKWLSLFLINTAPLILNSLINL